VVQTNQREKLNGFLASKGITTAIHYPAILPDMKPFFSKGEFHNARNLAYQGLSLPLNPYLKQEEIDRIIYVVQQFFKA
jgi:dTDP-4-amino-4,6-dideoxygalactose transaminase